MKLFEIFKFSLLVFAFSFTLANLFFRKELKIGNKEKSTFGGLVIFISIFLGILLTPYRNQFHLWRMFLPYGLMFVLGFWDDQRELSPYIKLFFQILIFSTAIFLGIRTEIIYLPHFLNVFITICWMLMITNAFNFLDIMDGLCLGIMLIVSLALTIIGAINFQPLNLLFALFIFASLLGFFPFNYKEAFAYLGDSGSLSLGFLISVLTISFRYAGEANPLALLTPLVILGLPIFDFSYVTLRRLLKRRSILRKSSDHLALLMEKKGMARSKVVNKLWLLGFGFSFSALVIQFGSFVFGILALIFALLLSVKMAIRYYR